MLPLVIKFFKHNLLFISMLSLNIIFKYKSWDVGTLRHMIIVVLSYCIWLFVFICSESVTSFIHCQEPLLPSYLFFQMALLPTYSIRSQISQNKHYHIFWSWAEWKFSLLVVHYNIKSSCRIKQSKLFKQKICADAVNGNNPSLPSLHSPHNSSQCRPQPFLFLYPS